MYCSSSCNPYSTNHDVFIEPNINLDFFDILELALDDIMEEAIHEIAAWG